jgi:hypothetical protein
MRDIDTAAAALPYSYDCMVGQGDAMSTANVVKHIQG